MSKKSVMILAGIFFFCFLITGISFKTIADKKSGISVTTGIMVDGEFKKVSAGAIGADPKKAEMFDSTGNMCFVISGGLAIVCITMFIKNRRS